MIPSSLSGLISYHSFSPPQLSKFSYHMELLPQGLCSSSDLSATHSLTSFSPQSGGFPKLPNHILLHILSKSRTAASNPLHTLLHYSSASDMSSIHCPSFPLDSKFHEDRSIFLTAISPSPRTFQDTQEGLNKRLLMKSLHMCSSETCCRLL